ncbi:hypothetical protein HPULCUR_004233 [Helicostylum pulchrum]|uniref:Uncharacterized protein n=1 Tax=Helicostylum pulchrum TaxID=562976 RepID=A0ABP9XVM4_9FUNG
MTETCKLDLKKFKYHLKLYNRYDALENEGGKSAQVNLIKKKKRGEQGQRIVEIEKELHESSLWIATSIDDLTNKYSKHDGYKRFLLLKKHGQAKKKIRIITPTYKRSRMFGRAQICWKQVEVSHVYWRSWLWTRDEVSALAIGLSGAASLILDIAFPSSDPNTSQSKTERFKNTAVAFLK